MKTFTRLFFLFLLMGFSVAKAQLVITPDPSVPSNVTFTISNPNAVFEHGISLTNSGSTPMTVKAFRNLVNLSNSGQSTFFCWGETCYDPTVEESTSITINPGQTLTHQLKNSVEANGFAGQIQVGFRFQVTQNGQTTNRNVTFTYTAQPTSINPTFVANAAPKLSVPMPNPAASVTRIEYNLMGATNGTLRIFDLLGKEVQDIALSPEETSLQLNVSNMKPGLYFYTLYIKGKATATQRLIVTK